MEDEQQGKIVLWSRQVSLQSVILGVEKKLSPYFYNKCFECHIFQIKRLKVLLEAVEKRSESTD